MKNVLKCCDSFVIDRWEGNRAYCRCGKLVWELGGVAEPEHVHFHTTFMECSSMQMVSVCRCGDKIIASPEAE